MGNASVKGSKMCVYGEKMIYKYKYMRERAA